MKHTIKVSTWDDGILDIDQIYAENLNHVHQILDKLQGGGDVKVYNHKGELVMDFNIDTSEISYA